MKFTSTPNLLRHHFLFTTLCILLLTVFSGRSYAQTKNFAQVTPRTDAIAYYTPLLGQPTSVSNTAAGSVTNPSNASAVPSVSPAVLSANYFNLLGLASAEGEATIQLTYASPLAAGKTTYIPFDQPTVTGLNLDLLALVGDLTGLFSKNIVTLEAYSGATSSTDGTRIPPVNVTSRVVRDASGRNYFAVTSTSPYNSVKVRLRYGSSLLGLSLGATINMNVYTAFNYTDDSCGTSVFTSLGESSSVNVSLTTLVSNPERAIDNNFDTFSQLQSGVVGLGSTVSQTILLNGLSSPGDVAKVVLSQTGTVLSLNVLGTITLQALNGNTPVGGVQSASNLLNLQLLTGAASNRFAVYFTPGAPFDRIRITVNNTLAVGGNILSGGLNVHEVQRTVAKPLFGGTTNGALSICGGSGLSLSGQNLNPAYTYNFYKKVNNVTTQVASANAGTYTESGLSTGTYTYYIAAQRAGCPGESDRDSVVVTVRPTLVFATTALTNGSVGRAYSRQINPATGGTPGYTYALAAQNALPAGLTLSPSGLISGTPTAAGTTPFTVNVTDSFGCTTTASFSITVTPALVLPAGTLPSGTVGTAYPSTPLPTASGGSTPYTYTAVNIPPGLSLDPSTGVIAGTPTLAGNYSFPVTITDADGNSASTNYTILVRDPLALPGATLADGLTGQVYPTQIIPAATGGSGIFTYSATGLPPGLAFNPSTREITGTPTQAGPFTASVTVTDNEGRTITTNYPILVRQPLGMGGVTLPDGTVGVNYPAQTIPGATGGTGPYTYTAANVPPGLVFDSVTRTITGTPTQSGTFTISVTTTDNTGANITVPYTLRVAGALSLPQATLPGAIVGSTYTSTALPAVTGGTAPYIYSMTNIPAGLSFNPATRVVSGTPTTAGNYTLTMSVSDNGGLTTSTDYTLAVAVPAPVVASTTICGGNTTTLAVSNQVAGVTYNYYSSTGNTPVSTGAAYTTPVLTQTTTFYVEAVSGTVVSARVPVTITVNPTPAAPALITNNLTISSGQTATLQATADASATINWYATPTGGVPLASGASFTTPVLTATTTYYAGTVNETGCASATRVPAVVTVIGGPANPNCNAAASQQSNITGLLCALCTIQDPGNSTDANPDNFTQIRVTLGVAASGYQRLIFQRTGLATDSIKLDLETPSGLLDLGVLGGVTVNVMNGNTVVRSYPLNNSLVSLNLLGGNRFRATVAATAPYDRVEVRLTPVVTALTSLNIYGAQIILPNPTIVSGNQTICSGSTASLNATAQGGTTIAWFSAATGGSPLSTTNTYTTPTLTATTTYYIQVSNSAGCANPTRIPVTVTVTPPVATPVLATIAPVCSGSNGVLSVENPQPGITYNWYTAATGGTPVFTGPVFSTPALTANTTYYLEAANGNCTSGTRVTANIVVNPRPSLPQIQASATTVSSGQTVTLTASSAEAGVVFNWYATPEGTTPVFTGATYVTPPNFATTTYYLEAASATTGCASLTRVQQTITVNANGTPVPVLCETPVSQTTGVGGTLSVLARVDNAALAIDADQLTASTLSVPVGINSFVFQRVNFAGLSTAGDTLRIRLTSTNQLLSASVLSGITITTLQGGVSNGDGVLLNNGLINLQLLNGGAEAIINLVPTAQFDGAEVRLNSGLLSALSAVNFNYARRIISAPGVVAANVTACSGATASLAVATPQTGVVYRWYDATGNTLLFEGATFTPTVTANTRFLVEASRGGCGGSRTAVDVTVTPAPLVPVLLSNNEQTCQGSNLELQVQQPQEGVTYQWFLDGAEITGATGPSYSIINIQDGGVYAVSAINTCGVTSARAEVTITVGSLTAPVITPSATTINAGERTVLTASSSTSGLTFNWYTTDPTTPGATPVFTSTDGTYIATPATTTTYYVTAQATTGGCISPAASVVITVNTVTPAPGSVPCEPAISQSTTVGGTLSVLAAVDNPESAVDADAETSSSLTIPVGVNSFVAQRLMFNGASQLGDTVSVRISSPAGRLSLAVGSSITLSTYNNNVSNGDVRTISSSTLNVQLGSDGTSAIITFVPTQIFDAVELRLNSGLLGALTSVNFNYARRIAVAPTVAASTVNTCEGSQASLAVANPITGTTYNWYLGTDLVATSPIYLTPTTLTAGTYVYSVSALRNGCESARTPVTVVVSGTPPAAVPNAANPANTCPGTPVTLSVEQVDGVTHNWYDAATGGNLLAYNTDVYTTAALSTPGMMNFYVEAVNTNLCASTATRTLISVTINPTATDADINITGADRAVCAGGTATLTASSATVLNPVFTWYTDAALTNAVFTGPVYTVSSAAANATYYVTVSGSNRCENTAGTARAVTLQVNPAATAADVTISGIPAGLCAGSSVTLTASSATVANPVFTWYSDAALTNAVFTGPAYTVTALTGNTNLYVTVQGTDRCPNTAANARVIQLTVNPTALASDINVNGVPASVCSGSGATLTASSTTITNPVFTWYTDAALSNAVFTGPVFNTPSITAATNYYVTVSGDNSCENTAANARIVTLNVNPAITFNGSALPAGIVPLPYLAQINPATGGTPGYNYTVASGNTLPPGLSLSSAGTLIGVPTVAGNYTFDITVADSRGCNATATFTLSVNSIGLITMPPATLHDGIVGSPYVPVEILPAPVGGTGPFTYVTNNLPAGFSFDPSTRELSGTPAVGGTFTFGVTVTDANGLTATTNYTVVVNVPAPVVAAAESCNGSSALLSVTNPVPNVVYSWYASASGGTALASGPTFQTPAISATTTYYAEGRSGTAVSDRTPATVTLKPNATSADITITGLPAAELCSGSGVTLTASSTTVTGPVFNWYSDVALTNLVFTGDTFVVPSLNANTRYFVTVSGANRCENLAGTANEVAINVNPAISFNGAVLGTAALSTPYSVQIPAATGGTPVYTYSLASGSSLPAGFTLSASGLLSGSPAIAGNYTFDVVVTDSRGCNASATFALSVINGADGLALPPAILVNGEVGTSYTPQTIPSATGGTGPFTYTATNLPPGLGFDPATREISGIPTSGGTFNPTITVTDAAGATATANYTITVTVPAPVVQSMSTCAGSSVTLAVQNPVPNVTYNWYQVASGGTAIANGPNFPTPVINSNVTYYVEGTSGSATSTRTAVTVVLGARATSADIIITGEPVGAICPGSSLTLTASSNTVQNPVFTWYTDAALTNAVSTDATFTVPSLPVSTTYYVTVRGDNRCENTSGNARAVALTVNQPIIFNTSSLPEASASTTYAAQLTPATGGTPGYTYTVASGTSLPAGLTLSTSGVLSGTPTDPGTYTFSVTASDSKGCNATAAFSLTVGQAPPAMSLPTATLPDGTIGTPYAPQTLPAAVGGTGPFLYVATNLPPGLTFNPTTREITGTPSLAGTFTTTVTVTDASGTTATANYVINVNIPAPVVSNAASCGGSSVVLTVQNPVTGVAYSWFTTASGGTAVGTGTSFTTPPVTTSSTYYVEATSGSVTTSRIPVSVTLAATAGSSDIVISGEPGSAICAGTPVTLIASSTSVVNPVFTWYQDSALSNAVFTGNTFTPATTANATYYVTVRGDNRCENTSGTAREITLQVNPALIFNSSVLPVASTQSAYTLTLDPATGGTPGYTYIVSSGSSLPDGLILSSAGVISGTPATSGTYNFAITATDAAGCNATANFTLGVGTSTSRLAIPAATLPDGTLATVYPPQTIPSATGGTGPYNYVATGLPPGLAFDPATREVTGTPTLGGTFTVTVTVTDGTGETTTGTYTIVVTVPAPVVASTQSCDGSGATLTVSNPVTGVTYNWYATASGGAILNTGTTFQTPAITANTTYYAEGVSGTASSLRTPVTVTLLTKLATPVVTRQSSTFTSITFAWNDVPGATSYEVSRNDGATWESPSSGADSNTHLVFGLQTNETVTLLVRAKAANGCQTSDAGSHTARSNNGTGADPEENDVFVPNTFTPNGDGNNDIFFAYSNSMVGARMRIYDQWGHVLYISQQMQNGWDGTYRGQPQPNGVYVYIIDVTMKNGTTVMKKGTVTLLR